MSRGASSGVMRATVCCSRLVSPVRGRSCFGVRRLESGQRRVPEPPAITTAYMWASLLDPMGAGRLVLPGLRGGAAVLRVGVEPRAHHTDAHLAFGAHPSSDETGFSSPRSSRAAVAS